MNQSKPVLVGVLYWPSEKPKFLEYPVSTKKESNISNIQECYLIDDFNTNLLSENKILLDKQYHDF